MTLSIPTAYDEEARAAAEFVAGTLVRFGLATPAVVFMESVRPLSRFLAIGLGFAQPLLEVWHPSPHHAALRELLGRSDGIDFILERIEALDP